ncbi:rhythmically expressed gene 2 protein-like [Fopius arisanus]|uniref:Rhythmically expressed gene 2 protein-like n=1 Tax=Fopius arisanus TaxID=64838 RepID=A0A9R1SYD9_9HYME|nr:PREDICTED: rhythmically expressed gene 2 protein-like [Fopius arisanus]
MPITRPRLVTFDVTGTLLRTKLEHYGEIGMKYGAPELNLRVLAPSFKQHYSRLSREHPVFGKHTGLGWQNWWKNLVYGVFRDQHPGISQDILEKVSNNLVKLYGTHECWEKYPGTKDILSYLNERDVIIGVISNFDDRLENILESTGIREHFSFVLTSYDYGCEKPELGIFEEALKLGGKARGEAIKPAEAFHVGDNFKLDYIGAKRAGWYAFLMTHDCQTPEKYKDIPKFELFANLAELKDHFKTLLN